MVILAFAFAQRLTSHEASGCNVKIENTDIWHLFKSGPCGFGSRREDGGDVYSLSIRVLLWYHRLAAQNVLILPAIVLPVLYIEIDRGHLKGWRVRKKKTERLEYGW